DVGDRRLLQLVHERRRVRSGRREGLALGGDAARQAREQALEDLREDAAPEAHAAREREKGPIVTGAPVAIGWTTISTSTRSRCTPGVTSTFTTFAILGSCARLSRMNSFARLRRVSVFGAPTSSVRREPYSACPSSTSSPRGVKRRMTIACSRLS